MLSDMQGLAKGNRYLGRSRKRISRPSMVMILKTLLSMSSLSTNQAQELV
jgi:hypothetical protein